MRSYGAALASILLGALVLASNETSWAEEVRASAQARLMLERLKDVALTDEQTKAIGGLTARFEVEFAEAEKQATPTPEQRVARERALRDAFSEGKKGADARTIIARASSPTEEQQRATERMRTLNEAFERAVFVVLTEAQRQRMAVSEHGLNTTTGYLIVRLNLDLPPDLDPSANLLDVAKTRQLKELDALRDTLLAHGIRDVRRLVRWVPEARAQDPDKQGELDRVLRRLRSYWRIDARSKPLEIDQILRQLRGIPAVELAYREPTLGNPSVISDLNPYSPLQGYLNPAPVGVDARYAWTKRNGEGQGVGLVDVERDWNLNHEDIVGQLPTVIFGDAITGDHGTGVLGSIVAENNTVGVIGVAPSPSYVMASSYSKLSTDETYVTEAIVVATAMMNRGDVMLLEVGLSQGTIPVELMDPYFDATVSATLQGMIVVEAAGDGGLNLDAMTDVSGRFVFNKASADFRDSGAIFVGGSDPRNAQNRCSFSCYGSRIDCFAWGRYVVTCGEGDLSLGGGNPNKMYRQAFGGTSSAAAIITGAAIVLQARIKVCTGKPATPARLRALLSNSGTGTLQGPGVSGNIGVMPNLRAIIDSIEKNCP
jgi:Subtilase family